MPFDFNETVIDSPVVRLLRLGYERIKKGWCQRHAMLDGGGGKMRFCLVGSVGWDEGMNTTAFDLSRQATSMIDLAVQKLTRGHYNASVHFNDAWDRHHEDVLQVMNLAEELQERNERGLPI